MLEVPDPATFCATGIIGVSTAKRLAKRLRIVPDACWIWVGAIEPKGYGRIWSNRTNTSPHRLAYLGAHGPLSDGLVVRHECDVRVCANPAHLISGTVADNIADATRRGRYSTPASPSRHGTRSKHLRTAANAGDVDALLVMLAPQPQLPFS